MSTPRTSSRREISQPKWLAPALLGGLLVLVHLALPGSIPWQHRLLAALPGVAAIYASWTYLVERKTHRLPFIEYALVQAYVFWDLPLFITHGGDTLPVSDSAMTTALVAIALTVSVILLAVPFGARIGRAAAPHLARLLPPSTGPAIGPLLLPWLAIAVAVHGGLPLYLPESLQYPTRALGGMCPLLAYLAIEKHRKSSQKLRIYFVVAVALLAAAGMFTGKLSSTLTPLVVAGVLEFVISSRLPLRAAALFVGLAILLQPAKLVYRSMAWGKGDRRVDPDISLSVSRWTDAVDQSWFQGNQSESVESIATRLDELRAIAETVAMTPGRVPLDHGKKWVLIPLSIIPRVIWKNKPDYTVEFNNRYNITFGFQTALEAESSTAAFPLVADGWWNFEWLGLLFVGSVVGVLLGIFSTAIDVRSWGPLSLGSSLLLLLNVRTHLSAQVNGILQTLIAVTILCWVIRFLSLGGISRRHSAAAKAH